MTYADSFHKTRMSPWAGWSDLVQFLPHSSPAHYVDIGCGNGRWFRFLIDNQIFVDSGIGLDLDTYLLGQARFSFIKDSQFRFYQGDCIEMMDDCIVHFGTPNVLTSFGLWHHIPSYALRVDLLKKLFTILAPGGSLIVSCWQFADDEAYRTKLISPEVASGVLSLPLSEFEQGDYFLGWQSNASVMRYCHSFTAEEITRMALEITPHYSIVHGNGNDSTNAYVILSRSLV